MSSLINRIYKPRMFAIMALVYSFQAFASAEPVSLKDITRGTLISRNEQGELEDIPLLNSEIHSEVTGQIARTTIVQHFKNPAASWMEALYLFPLPHDAAVDQMKMTVGDRIIEGQIKERKEAKATYEKAKSEGKQAALVEQDRPNIFSTSVANIPPNGYVTITLEYQQSIEWRDGEFSIRFPLTITPRYSVNTPAKFEVSSTVELNDGWSLLPKERPQAIPLEEADNTPDNSTSIEVVLKPGFQLSEIESLHHNVSIQGKTDGTQVVSLVDQDVRADQDFVLRWKPVDSVKPTASFFSESTSKGDYGLLTLVPPTVDGWKVPPREVIFVIDTSGSMSGQSIVAARDALMAGVNGLSKDDTFNIIEFNTNSYSLFARPQEAYGYSLSNARKFIRNLEARDGTEMEPALDMALNMPGESDRLQQVIFITDGSVSNEAQLFAKINRELGSRRLFTVGIGSAPNTYFMEESARVGRGTYTYIADLNFAEQAMKALFEKISKPALTNIKVMGYGVSDITPNVIPDLYAGEPLTVAMKMDRGVKRILITGRLGDTEWKQTAVIDSVGHQSGIGVDWARKMIAQWQRAAFKGVERKRVREEVLALALEHHLVSPYTSLVAVDVTPVRPTGDGLDSKSVPPTRPKGLEIQLAKGASGYELSLMIAALIALLGALLVMTKREVV